MTLSVNSVQLKSDSPGSYLDSGMDKMYMNGFTGITAVIVKVTDLGIECLLRYRDYTIFDQVSMKIYTYTPSKVTNWAFRFSTF
ncbi:hypothetical protein TorRG33x02_149960 [Trema orientale]|uniref:Uncharacterized protein n=1 Tax=Trema orientale TaxID=63057 RepID=A0A2P5EUA9_TREOI|nr:hypothetical protein TorRG33x02_149960 [Trema orientale]